MKEKTSTFSAITSSETNEWYTPPWLMDIVKGFYGGEIDLDPASNELAQTWINAKKYYTKEQDGFGQKWEGKIWLNPPYGNKNKETGNYGTSAWCGLAANYWLIAQKLPWYKPGDIEILLLVGGDSEGKRLAMKHGLTLQFKQRIRFIDENGNEQKSPPPAPNLIYLGHRKSDFIQYFGQLGIISEVVN